MNADVTVRCRICGDGLSQPILSLLQMPLTDEFRSPESTADGYIADIRIYQCQHCGIVQNPDDFDHDSYYLDYQYSSGHSEHTDRFMMGYAKVVVELFEKYAYRPPQKILEIGSGDGEQLIKFKELACSEVKGVEPSAYLAKIAEQKGVSTEVALFGAGSLAEENSSYDICLSSYTFDHVRSPIEYLKASYALLGEDGLVAVEVHNLEKIIERSEYCLFEHEHTVYLTPNCAEKIFNLAGFKVIAIDPLPDAMTRANSLIVVGRKRSTKELQSSMEFSQIPGLDQLRDTISGLVTRIEAYASSLPSDERLVGFGVGGRGVMTLAALSNYARFSAMLDSNYDNKQLLTPKTGLPIFGPSSFKEWNDANCLVFSYGYFGEIQQALIKAGFNKDKIISLADFM